MKPIKPLGIILLSLNLLCFASCDKDTDAPISLQYVENNTLDLVYPVSGGYTRDIMGGDGKYTVVSSDERILGVMLCEGQTLQFEPLAIGEAKVTIRDRSGHTYVLTVNISYMQHAFMVTKCEVTVTGAKLTAAEKTEIESQALATIPVKVGGGYRFVFTDAEQTKGDAYIFPEKFGAGTPEQSTFEQTLVNLGGDVYYRNYIVATNTGVRSFVIMSYSGSPTYSSLVYPVQFAEDLTDRFKPVYPNVEGVYTTQVITYINNFGSPI